MNDQNKDLLLDPFLIASAAGILEGEGCFSIFRRKDRRKTCTVAIHCEMTDEDIIVKLYSIFNVGTVLTRPNMSGRQDRRERKPTYIWSVQNQAGFQLVCNAVLPYMGNRRTSKIHELLGYINEGIAPASNPT